MNLSDISQLFLWQISLATDAHCCNFILFIRIIKCVFILNYAAYSQFICSKLCHNYYFTNFMRSQCTVLK